MSNYRLQYQYSRPVKNKEDGYHYQRVRQITDDGRVVQEFTQRSVTPNDDSGMFDPERGFDKAFLVAKLAAAAGSAVFSWPYTVRTALMEGAKLAGEGVVEAMGGGGYPRFLRKGYQSWPGTERPWDRSTEYSDPNPKWEPEPLERLFQWRAPPTERANPLERGNGLRDLFFPGNPLRGQFGPALRSGAVNQDVPEKTAREQSQAYSAGASRAGAGQGVGQPLNSQDASGLLDPVSARYAAAVLANLDARDEEERAYRARNYLAQ